MPDQKTPAEIEDAAIEWVAKVERGLTPEEQANLDQWLESNSRHLGAFVRAQAVWIHAERATALGARPTSEPKSEPEEVPADQIAEERPIDHRVSFGRRRVIVGGGALVASVAAAGFFVSNRPRTIESGVGEIRHLALAGGTNLVLDTDTRVDVALSSDARRVELVRGKIFLEVARASAPIIVRTASLMLAITEGAFGVQNLPDAAIVALVTRGSLVASQSQGMFAEEETVSVDQDHALTLSPSARLRADDVRPIAAPQREQLLAWRDGMLSFGGEALADAVRAFDRYGATRIVVVDATLARQRVTGLFKADDPKGFARAVAASFGAVVSVRGDVVQLSGKNSTPA